MTQAARPLGSQVHIERLEDHLAAQWAVALVNGLLQEDFRALPTQAQVPAGQKQYCLGLVLTDDAFLTFFLFFQEHPGVII